MNQPLISVSGVRGIVGEVFIEDLVRRWAAAFARKIGGSQVRLGDSRIVVGRDTRPSGQWALELAIKTLEENGVGPIIIGVASTPTAQLAVTHWSAQGAMLITASHNPSQWNGLKFLGADGVFLSGEEMKELTQQAYSEEVYERVTGCKNKKDPVAGQRHLENILIKLPINLKQIRSRRLKVVLDPVNGAGALVLPRLLELLNCQLTVINGEPNGQFAHPPEPTPANLTQLCDKVREMGADIGLAVDPDADRLALVNEKGEAISEEYTPTLATLALLENNQLPITNYQKKVVVNLSTSRMVEDVAARFGVEVLRSAVGERYVVDLMRQSRAIIGGEGNGGVIYPTSHYGRDSLVATTFILDLLARRPEPLSVIIAALPQYVMRKEKFPRSGAWQQERIHYALTKFFPGASINTTDGIRVDLPYGWVQLRPSNTEPVVRLIGEARNEIKLNELLQGLKPLL